MRSGIDTAVLIVGGGPVGLTLAVDLAWRGIDVIVAEIRHPAEPPPVKCNHIAARSMEIFRRLGVAQSLRNAGLPEDYPNDVAYRTSFTGIELTRIPIPCRRDRYTATGGPDTWWPTPEPPHRINQLYMEPILFRHAEASARIRILSRTEVEGFTQDGNRVVASARDLDSGERRSIACSYLVGCDGGRSLVRRLIGASFQGDAVVQRVQSTFIRAPTLRALQRHEPAWGTFSLNPVRPGNVYAIDGRTTWLVHNYLRESEADFDAIDRDWAIRTILGVGPEFSYDVISKEDWIGRRLVADRFRQDRVFICGDAAHIWVPYAGYGMNAGIADAANLAWLLAAHLNGWAPSAILDAHESERLPITEQVSRFAMNHAHAMTKQRGAVPPDIEADTPAAAAARTRLGKAAYDLNVQQYCCAGLNFGYYYDRSPIIAYDDEPPPPYAMASFTSSTVPGCRAPHVELPGRGSLYDFFGKGYALMRLDPAADPSPLIAVSEHRRIPLTLLDTGPIPGEPAYRHKLVLVRPDQHVAWRGDQLPADPGALVDRISGVTI